MILSDNKLIEYVRNNLLIKNCDVTNIQSASIDVTLGDSFKVPTVKDKNKIIILGKDVPDYKEFNKTCIIEPHSFILGTIKEELNIPPNIGAFIEGKSSIGRSGIFIQNAGWICPGFEGQITLEIFNANNYPVEIRSGISIGQIIFMHLTNSCTNPYKGKYNGQLGATVPTFIEGE